MMMTVVSGRKCPNCNDSIGYGIKDEANSFKVFVDCMGQCGQLGYGVVSNDCDDEQDEIDSIVERFSDSQ